ncbi:hypothetical protein WME98_34320 [Sorangium sp. So ce296]|uniref:hypothetical protein n=1 Tax=Sorangium sp. So ce296 TaxID=3133296 RepID=UPI003F5DCB10
MGHHRLGCRFAATLLLTAMTAGLHVSGCLVQPDDADKKHDRASGQGATGGNGGSGGNGGGGGVIPTPECDPQLAGAGVDDGCGVFVSEDGDDGAVGTKEAPLRSIGEAIARVEGADKPHVYVCVGTFEEAVSVQTKVSIFGRLDCKTEGANWRWTSTAETILTTPPTAPPGTAPLTMSAAGKSVRIEDFHVVAPPITVDLEDPDNPDNKDRYGKSSIAVIADGGNIALERCTFDAGEAAPGAPGALHRQRATKGGDGSSGSEACTAGTVTTDEPPENDCGMPNDSSDNSIGGLGGIGTSTQAGLGAPGSPGEDANPNGGTRSSGGACGNGKDGQAGKAGDAGDDAKGTGAIDSTGFTGLTGGTGKPGTPGQGGGGGAGARGGSACPAGSPGLGGASGGSGGAGGCGGEGGKGGGPGGSSIALLSINATLTFEDVLLKAKAGGRGGPGGEGQVGGAGGALGRGGTGPTALSTGCDGGRGGDGGPGGPGGKGSDGHSLGIAYLGHPPPEEGEGVVAIEVGAARGNGLAEKMKDFTNASASP